MAEDHVLLALEAAHRIFRHIEMRGIGAVGMGALVNDMGHHVRAAGGEAEGDDGPAAAAVVGGSSGPDLTDAIPGVAAADVETAEDMSRDVG